MIGKILFAILLFPFFINAQGLRNLWLLGYNSGTGPLRTNIDFYTGLANISSVLRQNSFFETEGSINSSNGLLHFYSNGVAVFDINYDTIQNGDNLNPSQFTTTWSSFGLPIVQGNIIIPMPGDTSKYYLFHETAYNVGFNVLPKELYYSVVDMALNGGFGAVIQKNIVLIGNDTMDTGKITTVKHGNGRDWWVIKHDVLNNKFYCILASPSGFQVNSQNIGTARMGALGQTAFSPDGSKYAYYDFFDDLDIFDFDRCSGLFSNWQHVTINDSADAVGVAFSPDSKVLYASSTKYVYQFDCLAPNINASQITVAVWDTFYSPSPPFATTFYLCQNANDNKVYISTGNSTYHMHKINNPDSLGLGCNVQQHSVQLPTYNAFSIPNHPNYFLGPLAGSICDSLGLSVTENVYSVNLNLRVNPNPAQNGFYLNYQLPNKVNAEMKIFNTLGEEMMRKKLYWYFGYLQVDVSMLNNGVYFISVVTEDKHNANAKVVIAK